MASPCSRVVNVSSGVYGPDGPFEVRGLPTQVDPSGRAKDAADARELWDRSEELTGVRFELLDAAIR